jgi:hypothetical protein
MTDKEKSKRNNMKIYRAVLEYNNAYTCEWERWYTKVSVWYTTRDLAEKHLSELNKYLDHLKVYFKEYIGMFKYNKPFIEEREVHSEYVEMNIDYNKEFYE